MIADGCDHPEAYIHDGECAGCSLSCESIIADLRAKLTDAREVLSEMDKQVAEPARKAVCVDCGGPILHTWCLEVAAKQKALGKPEHAPVRCVDCLWTRICRI